MAGIPDGIVARYRHEWARGRRATESRAWRDTLAQARDRNRRATIWARDHDVVSCVVQFVNKVAADAGLDGNIPDLPTGVMGSGESCPIANAFYNLGFTWVEVGEESVQLRHGYYYYDNGVLDVAAPVCVTAFVTMFDAGRFPEYSSFDEYSD